MQDDINKVLLPYIENCVFILEQSYAKLMARGMPKDIAAQFSWKILQLIMEATTEKKKEGTPDLSTLMAVLSPGGSA